MHHHVCGVDFDFDKLQQQRRDGTYDLHNAPVMFHEGQGCGYHWQHGEENAGLPHVCARCGSEEMTDFRLTDAEFKSLEKQLAAL